MRTTGTGHDRHGQMRIPPATRLLAGAVTMLALLAALGCAPGGETETLAEVLRNVRVMTLERTSITEYFEISGPVRPVRGTDVSAEEAGTVAAIPHDKGARVAADDVLVELDRRLLREEKESAHSSLELHEYNYDKTRQLHEARKVSRHELLTTEAQYEQAKALSRIADLRYERAAVKAPFAGLVTDRFVEPGQLVAPGMPVARIIDPYTLKLVGSLTEREIGWARPGTETEVALDGHEEAVAGTIHWVGFEADPLNGKFKVDIHIPNPDLALRSGVVGRARVEKRTHPDVVAIPRDALLPSRGKPAVFVVEGDSAVVRTITLGPDQGLMVVVADGLESGDRLVVRGQRDLVPGAKVQVTEVASAADGSNGTDPEVVKGTETHRADGRGQEGGE